MEVDILRPMLDEELLTYAGYCKQNWPMAIRAHHYLQQQYIWHQKLHKIDDNLTTKVSDRCRMSFFTPTNSKPEECTFVTTCGETDYAVFFYTLEDPPVKLEAALRQTSRINWQVFTVYSSVEERHQKLILDLIKEKNLDLVFKIDSYIYRLRKEVAKGFEITLPADVRLSDLQQEDIPMLASIWPHYYPGCERYLEWNLRLNDSLGLYNQTTNQLLSMVMRNESGAIGFLQTVEAGKRKGYGAIVLKAMSQRMAQEDNDDVLAFVMQTNTASNNLFQKIGYELVGNCSWLGSKGIKISLSRHNRIQRDFTMESDILRPLSDEELLIYADHCKKHWPVTIRAHHFLCQQFIWHQKLEQLDGITERCHISLFTPVDSRPENVTFVAITGENMDDYSIVYHTLEDPPLQLEAAVRQSKRINWELPAVFISVQKPHHNFLLDLLKEKDLELKYILPCYAYRLKKEVAKSFQWTLPDNVRLANLGHEDCHIMAEVWPIRYPGCERYLQAMLTLNHGIGLYEKSTNQLLAMVLRNENGALGIIQTIESAKQKGYASIVLQAFSKRLAAEDDNDVLAYVVQTNVPSNNLFQKNGYEIIFDCYWVGSKGKVIN